jgi:hypothetical protein
MAVAIEGAAMAVATLFGLHNVSIRNPHFNLGLVAFLLLLWYLVAIFIIQPAIVGYTRKRE